MAVSFDDIKLICKQYEHRNLYFYKEIPSKKLKNASESFKIPKTSEVIALHDNTIFGSCKDGLAICSDGIYFAKRYQKTYKFLWQNIISIDIDNKNRSITLNKCYCIDKLLSDFNIVIDLFLEIKDYLNIESLIRINNIKNSGNRDLIAKGILDICAKYICDKLYFKNSIDPSKLEKIKLNFKLPNNTNIITIYDNESGFAICYNGIYLRNLKNTILISWKDIFTINIDFASAAIVLNKYYNIYCSRDNLKVLSDLFLEMNNYLNQDYIPNKVSEKRIPKSNMIKDRKNELDKNIPKVVTAIQKEKQPKNKLININDASLDQLLILPYFTLERAEKILSERRKNFIFTSVDDIIEVLNLKPHEAENLKECLSFETNGLKKNYAKREVDKKSEKTISNNIDKHIKGRIIDY